ncbi:response regulator [Treponema sp.]|uniref:response regulator transcription factor n=1 Tax=Treponema sp. TaxID=166 RepID=UPI0025FAEC5D|nr:response regulator [Treponema sp.]MCR5218271.1 response regulator [Treponema sp.]
MAKKILIADDEELVRSSLHRYIKNHCPSVEQVFEAGDGGSAIEMIIKNIPDIVILDVQMPVYTGIDVMRLTKEAGLAPVFIILSGYNDFEYAQQAMHYGAKEYIMKPVKASQLADLVNSFASKQTVKDEVISPDKRSSITRAAVKYIDDHYSENISLSVVAGKLGLSASYLSTKFSQDMGMGFVDYVNKVRIEKACLYLKHGYYKVYEISEKVGFNDTKYFTKLFKKITGSTPKKYMQGEE